MAQTFALEARAEVEMLSLSLLATQWTKPAE